MSRLPFEKTVPCKGCGKPIRFVTSTEGKQIPLDVRAPVYHRRTSGAEEFFERDGFGDQERTAFVTHFATCSKASEFSNKKAEPKQVSAPRPAQGEDALGEVVQEFPGGDSRTVGVKTTGGGG